jgi:hypothetical protein
VSITGAATAQATFTAAANQVYAFRLTVTDDRNASSRARVTVTTAAAPQVKIARFSADPPVIQAGQTTTYTITAKNGYGEVTTTTTVSVIRMVEILDFAANPTRVLKAGDAATLQWRTENATSAVITGVGPVPVNGSVVVNPSSDVSYTLIAYGRRSQVVAIVTLRVGANNAPVANAGPSQPHTGIETTLDGSGSYDPDGDSFACSWRLVGPPWAWIDNPNPCTTGVRLSSGFGEYTFQLTVTDDKRATSSAMTTVNYIEP